MISRRTVLAAFSGFAFSGATIYSTGARAAESRVFTGLIPGVGAGGYDVVVYQAEGRARKGRKDFVAVQGGVTYRFVNAANRDAFATEPDRYLPAYGGYCAWAVANGYTAKGDPEAWSVVAGRLYLNYSKSVRSQWKRDIPGNIARADSNWPGVLD